MKDLKFYLNIFQNLIIVLSTDVNQDGDFSKGNSKKIPTFLKEYLKRFCLNKPDQIMNMKFNLSVPYEEYRRGIRKPIYKKIIYWEMNR